jgi:hypothetical protein
LISITLPSLYPEACARALNNIRDATRSRYEIVMVSPFEPPRGHRHIWWIREDPAQSNGCNAGHAKALDFLTGDFVIPWVDDHFLQDGWDVSALRQYERRENEFHRQSAGRPFALGIRHCWPRHVGSEFGIYYAYFPLIRRKYLDVVGWFDPAYRKGFADSDFCFRIWDAGGRCEWSEGDQIVVHHDDDRKAGVVFEQADMDLFVRRWAPKYGRGWQTGKIRDFNCDVVPDSFPHLASNNTFYLNDPSFRVEILKGGWKP